MLYNTRTYSLDRYNSPDSVTYKGATHGPASKDAVTLSRVFPKPTKGNVGVAKPFMRQVKSTVVNAISGEKQDLIVYIGGSVPVGAADADIDASLADIAAFAASADAKALFKSLDVNV